MNGTIRLALKSTLRYWRDVHNRRHPPSVSGCQETIMLLSAYATSAHKRWEYAGKVLDIRIPQAEIPATTAALSRTTRTLLLHTLNQTRLRAGHYVYLAGRPSLVVRSLLAPKERYLKMCYIELDHYRAIPFPPHCQGFLYWHLNPAAPPTSGQIRFRTTASSDPAAFLSGQDLRLPDGGVWNISLLDIARRPRYSGLRKHLIIEGLVTEEVLNTALKIPISYQHRHHIPKSDVSAPAAAANSIPPLLWRTLNPTQLDGEDFVDISAKVSISVRLPLAPEESKLDLHYYCPPGRNYAAFPPASQGFFYWHLEPDAPPISGQVRFRTTRSSDPATFPSGRDLPLPDGRPWNISLFDIAREPQYSGFREHLLSENLVTAEVLDTAVYISALNEGTVCHRGPDCLLLWRFGQTFLVNLQSTRAWLWVVGRSAAERLTLPSLSAVLVRKSKSTGMCYVLSEYSDSRKTHKHDFLKAVDCTLFTGRALVQFERSTLPEHEGTRTVVLRIVRVMPNSDGFDQASWMPELHEDGLDMTGIHQHAWSLNVDRPPRGSLSLRQSAKALSILFENEALQERRERERPKSYA
ncbi:hypothetical protein OE88DRAFT_1657180 [Heliocybe sulcata]|uniref:Uncharacterized protein n=1 Tax=Heliocybe sulcata TaxID=5364 RepID=A0A5C3N885_9AGAM|nr:hypothetical protein OE88DRAFT_1657180 [Heliocybe sulcata]